LLKSILPPAEKRLPADFHPAIKNPAVALCDEVWGKIFQATLDKKFNLYTAERCASKAYRLALPSLSGYQNICDFIACVSYGILLGAIKPDTGTKLLYAAQVALGAIPKSEKEKARKSTSQPSRPRKAKLQSKNATPPPISSYSTETK
jgi:hypothetical protein